MDFKIHIFWIILWAALFCENNVETTEHKVVCYFPNWARYRSDIGQYTVGDINPRLCTHLVYAFARITGNSLTEYNTNDLAMYQELIGLRTQNPTLKLMLSIGGGTLGTGPWKLLSGTEVNRKEFSTNVIVYLRKHDFDGLDLDWEFPASEDRENFSEIIKELKSQFSEDATNTGRRALLLSCALGAARDTIDNGYDLPTIAQYVDFANIMAYDLHGQWDDVTGFHSALYGFWSDDEFSQEWVVNRYIDGGFPSHKMTLGIPTYGRAFKLCNSSNHELRDCSDGAADAGPYSGEAGVYTFYEICTNLKNGWTRVYDSSQEGVYAFMDDQWVSYDDKESITVKMEFVANYSLAGVMFWDLSQDDFKNQCGDGENPLISAAVRALASNETQDPLGDTKLVCYFPNWAQYRDAPYGYTIRNIDPHLCTHVIFAFADISGYNLATFESNDKEMYGQLNALKVFNSQLKTLLSVGGRSMGSAPFRYVSATVDARRQFAKNVITYLRLNGFDGFDVSWSYPEETDKEEFTELIAALRHEFNEEASLSTDQEQLLLTCSLGTTSNLIEKIYELPLFTMNVDFVNVLAFDLYNESQNVLSYHSALYGESLDDEFTQSWVVSKYLSRGLPPHKLVLGVPTYGRLFQTCRVGAHLKGDCAAENGTLTYYEICDRLNNGWTRLYDDKHKVVSAYSGSEWVSFEDPKSLREKVDYVFTKSLAGLAVWDLSQDDFSGICSKGQKNPLITSIRKGLEENLSRTTIVESLTTEGVAAVTPEGVAVTPETAETDKSDATITITMTKMTITSKTKTTTTPKPKREDVKLDIGTIVTLLAVIGGVFLATLFLVLLFLFIRKKRNASPGLSNLAKEHLAKERKKRSEPRSSSPKREIWNGHEFEDDFPDFWNDEIDFPPEYSDPPPYSITPTGSDTKSNSPSPNDRPLARSDHPLPSSGKRKKKKKSPYHHRTPNLSVLPPEEYQYSSGSHPGYSRQTSNLSILPPEEYKFDYGLHKANLSILPPEDYQFDSGQDASRFSVLPPEEYQYNTSSDIDNLRLVETVSPYGRQQSSSSEEHPFNSGKAPGSVSRSSSGSSRAGDLPRYSRQISNDTYFSGNGSERNFNRLSILSKREEDAFWRPPLTA